MSKRLKYLTILLLAVAPIYLPSVVAQKIIVSKINKLNLTGNDIIEVEPNTPRGFNFPYFLFIPDKIDRSSQLYLLVETNNTGTATDDFEVHREKALNLIKSSHPNRMARDLRVPLLVPVFPRPRTNWQVYTHALDRDSLEINEGQLKRLDLQLEAMIDHAIELLRTNGFKMHDKVFMHGFSASSKFCNRFAFLHPELVKAVASGGVNGLPTLPISNRNGHTLPFPIGIADIETFNGHPYNEEAHSSVAQYIYMGYLDRNDTLPSRDAWSEKEAYIIREAIAAKMMPDRWKISRDIYKQKLPCAQCVTYNRVAHSIKNEMINDIVKFFRANSTDSFVSIEPYEYPFIEYRQIHEAHVNAVYSKGDKNLPEFAGKGLREGKYLIGIEEWLKGQDYRQLDEFVDNAGFNFRLCAKGHPEIIITKSNYRGNSSMGNGKFQAFYMQLSESQLNELVPDVPYTLHPENKSDKYFWTVNDGVTLLRPVNYHDIILDKLNSTILPTVSIDGNIQDIVGFLQKISGDIDYLGETKKIEVVLSVEPSRLKKIPRIKFSAEGLSVMEVFLIICHRTSLDYRIEGTTIYLEDKK